MMNQLQIWFYLKNVHLFKNWLVCVTTYMTTRYYIEQQKASEVFLFLVQTNIFWDNSKKNCKGLVFQGNFVVSVLPSLPESPIMTSAGDICIMPAPHCFFTSIRFDTSNVITTIVSFTLMYCKTEIRFENYGIEYVKFVIRRLKFVFSDFFSLQIKLLLCCRSKLKHWMPPQCLKKSS